ncbi:MAG: Ppx/GppA phosphatase family protein [Pseudomonadota bacterium]
MHHNARNEDASYPTYGALDLGTNNCRLLVARPSRRGFLVVDAFSRIIRLGEGIGSNGALSQPAMDRTVDALQVCADKLIRRQVKRCRLVATEACRAAANGEEFIERVQSETGLSLEILTRESEARLAVCGCASLLDLSCDWALVFDIGGGSSELIWLNLAKLPRTPRRTLADRLDAQECISAWTSLPIGVVTLAERYDTVPMSPAVFEAMVQDVSAMLRDFERECDMGAAVAGGRVHMLGTSGTVTTVAGIHLGLKRYDRRRVDGSWLETTSVRRVSNELVEMSHEERVAQPCIGMDRADLVLAGCAILEAMLRVWPCERLRVADRGLREGILATLMTEDGIFKRSAQRDAGRPGQ